MVDLVELKRKNDARWLIAQLTNRLDASTPAKTAFRNKHRYINIIDRLNALGEKLPAKENWRPIPYEAWVFIAGCHYRESNFDFNTHMGQGDPLTRNGVPIKTVHVPANRGPFHGDDAFEQAAVDALWYCAPYACRINRDWTVSGMLTFWERFNGLKYANVGRPSPYVWSGTTVYDPPGGPGGKVLVDHGPIVNTVDRQLGVAAFLKKVDALDDAIDFGSVKAPPTAPDLDAVDWLYDDEVQDALWLQKALNKLGTAPRLNEDGVYGGATTTAVRAYQTSHHLQVDGKAGTIETIPSIINELRRVEVGY